MTSRRFRISVGGGLLAAAAAAVTVAAFVVPASAAQGVPTSSAPSSASLTRYAAAHGGKHVAGPIGTGPYYGAYADSHGLEIVKYAGGSWHADGKPITPYGKGRDILRIAAGGNVVPGAASFVERTRGADVGYFGGVVYDANGTWTPAHFGKCSGHKGLSCSYGGPIEPYGHIAMGSFVSINNDCVPYCAAGTNYLITWRWDAAKKHFDAVDVAKDTSS